MHLPNSSTNCETCHGVKTDRLTDLQSHRLTHTHTHTRTHTHKHINTQTHQHTNTCTHTHTHTNLHKPTHTYTQKHDSGIAYRCTTSTIDIVWFLRGTRHWMLILKQVEDLDTKLPRVDMALLRVVPAPPPFVFGRLVQFDNVALGFGCVQCGQPFQCSEHYGRLRADMPEGLHPKTCEGCGIPNHVVVPPRSLEEH